jgi:SAM-dependent methyltransferase
MPDRPDWYERWDTGRRRLIERAIADHAWAPGARVLDVAAGDTRYSDLVGELLCARVIGHDRGVAECAGLRARGIPAVRGDVRHLAFADGIADVTLAFEIIEHLPKAEASVLIDELHRVTKPGGTLLLSTPNRFALESVKGIVRYFKDGTVWNARDETHVGLYSRRELLAALQPRFDVRRTYGYYLLEAGDRRTPFSHAVTTSAVISNLCFILMVVATRRDDPSG